MSASLPPTRKPRRRRLRIAVVVIGAVALVAAFALRSPSPVGHWRSADGYDAFQDAYAEAMAEMPEPDQTLDLRTDFGMVRVYHFAGTGTDRGNSADPLMLINGQGSASPAWADNMADLLTLGDVYTIDLLGHPGMSVQERPITDNADQAMWLDQALAQLPEDRFHFVGLSIGGWTATNYATRHPEMVASLSLIDPVFTFATISAGFMVRSIPASIPWLPKSWRNGFNSWIAGGEETEEYAVGRMIDAGQEHYATKVPAPERISEEALSNLDVPVLAIIAGDSVVHDAQAAAQTAERTLTHGTVAFYEGASHAVAGQEAQRVAADIDAFLSAQE